MALWWGFDVEDDEVPALDVLVEAVMGTRLTPASDRDLIKAFRNGASRVRRRLPEGRDDRVMEAIAEVARFLEVRLNADDWRPRQDGWVTDGSAQALAEAVLQAVEFEAEPEKRPYIVRLLVWAAFNAALSRRLSMAVLKSVQQITWTQLRLLSRISAGTFVYDPTLHGGDVEVDLLALTAAGLIRPSEFDEDLGEPIRWSRTDLGMWLVESTRPWPTVERAAREATEVMDDLADEVGRDEPGADRAPEA